MANMVYNDEIRDRLLPDLRANMVQTLRNLEQEIEEADERIRFEERERQRKIDEWELIRTNLDLLDERQEAQYQEYYDGNYQNDEGRSQRSGDSGGQEIVAYPGGKSKHQFEKELFNFLGINFSTLTHLGETEDTPARPPQRDGIETRFPINFYPNPDYDQHSHPRNHCNWCNGRNTQSHYTVQCQLFSEDLKIFTLLGGWRCWGCAMAKHQIEKCDRFKKKECRICKSRHHSSWTHDIAMIVERVFGIMNQEQAINTSGRSILSSFGCHKITR